MVCIPSRFARWRIGNRSLAAYCRGERNHGPPSAVPRCCECLHAAFQVERFILSLEVPGSDLTAHFIVGMRYALTSASCLGLNCTTRIPTLSRRLASRAMPKSRSPNTCDINSRNDTSGPPQYPHLCWHDSAKAADSIKRVRLAAWRRFPAAPTFARTSATVSKAQFIGAADSGRHRLVGGGCGCAEGYVRRDGDPVTRGVEPGEEDREPVHIHNI